MMTWMMKAVAGALLLGNFVHGVNFDGTHRKGRMANDVEFIQCDSRNYTAGAASSQ